ncbi:mitochondrial import translocase subunit Tom22 [Dacryopinax primogenitus]|uniref:Mitochondrial import translocase subunit Tom22 n=1 Tax=Dacryopinax primogenitus (strain DJM 731) TaxID=1858805 RepID=M5FSC4_DACPD|nr:mitochondrial import translocase subunit Tom22 [Dacryopinax primogenitus]EJT98718.1 mitochondrial import translocase subunit Tom22 [Dacryopinax primogenitus]
MVKVSIENEPERQPGEMNSPYASSEASSSVSSLVSDLPAESETLTERIAALVDIVPPSTRRAVAQRIYSAASYVRRGGKIAGTVVWVITTSALLIGLPLALSLEDEAKFVAQEREVLAQQQGQQMLAPGVFPSQTGSQMPPQKSQGVVPPGF